MFVGVVKGRSLEIFGVDYITSGSVGLQIQFAFDTEWTGLAKSAVFETKTIKKTVLLQNDQCVIPWEVLEQYNIPLKIGVYGANGEDVVIPTIWKEYQIHRGTEIDGSVPAEFTPSVVEQIEARLTSLESDVPDIQEDLGDISELTTTDKSSVVDAINELNIFPLEKGTGIGSVQTRHDDDPTNACVASGADSLAFGARATATNTLSLAIGTYNRNVEDGAGPTCTGQQAIAFGIAAQATAHGAVAIGQQSKATAQLAFALGGKSEANAVGAYALGTLVKANGRYQFVTGARNIADDNNEFAFIVGNGTKVDNVETLSNAMTLDWNGNLKIAGGLTLGAGTENEITITPQQLSALLALLN